MPRKVFDDELMAKAIRLRYEVAMRSGKVPSWDQIAEHLGVSVRHLRRVRETPAWAEMLRKFGSPMDDENLQHARMRLSALIHSSDERVALQACRCILELQLARRLDVVHHGAVVQVQQFDLTGVTPEQLRRLAGTVAEVEGVGPGRRELPEAVVTVEDSGTVDAEPPEFGVLVDG